MKSIMDRSETKRRECGAHVFAGCSMSFVQIHSSAAFASGPPINSLQKLLRLKTAAVVRQLIASAPICKKEKIE